MRAPAPPNRLALAGGALLGLAAVAILWGERRRPLRVPTRPPLAREPTNAALGAMSLAVIAVLERPVSRALARRNETRRTGLAQRLPAPAWVRDIAAGLILDYTTYLWHMASHKAGPLWRLHLVHHVDLDLDASTALRFHAVDMVVSTPVRAIQISLAGASPRALAIWQGWFFLSVLFHHSNLRLPERWERRLARVVTTPRMHGIHHSASRDETDSNWSSGFSLWDHLHGTFRFDVAQDAIRVGVPRYQTELGLAESLRLPFGRRPDAWTPAPFHGKGQSPKQVSAANS